MIFNKVFFLLRSGMQNISFKQAKPKYQVSSFKYQMSLKKVFSLFQEVIDEWVS